MPGWLACWLAGCLLDVLCVNSFTTVTGWLVGWLVGLLVVLVGCMVGWAFCVQIHTQLWQVGWLANLLAGRLVGWVGLAGGLDG